MSLTLIYLDVVVLGFSFMAMVIGLTLTIRNGFRLVAERLEKLENAIDFYLETRRP